MPMSRVKSLTGPQNCNPKLTFEWAHTISSRFAAVSEGSILFVNRPLLQCRRRQALAAPDRISTGNLSVNGFNS